MEISITDTSISMFLVLFFVYRAANRQKTNPNITGLAGTEKSITNSYMKYIKIN